MVGSHMTHGCFAPRSDYFWPSDPADSISEIFTFDVFGLGRFISLRLPPTRDLSSSPDSISRDTRLSVGNIIFSWPNRSVSLIISVAGNLNIWSYRYKYLLDVSDCYRSNLRICPILIKRTYTAVASPLLKECVLNDLNPIRSALHSL